MAKVKLSSTWPFFDLWLKMDSGVMERWAFGFARIEGLGRP